ASLSASRFSTENAVQALGVASGHYPIDRVVRCAVRRNLEEVFDDLALSMSLLPQRLDIDSACSDEDLPGAGLEPAWGCPRGIFLPTTAFAAARAHRPARIWGLDFTFALPPSTGRSAVRGGLGRGRQVSTLSRRPRQSETCRARASGRRPVGLARCCSHRDVLLVHRL